MDLLIDFHLFSFIPVIAIGGIFWAERMFRHGPQKRTNYLFLALLAIAAVGIAQTASWVMKDSWLLIWPQLLVASGVLYFLAFMFLEYAIHVKRIEESFLAVDFRKGLKSLALWFGLFGGFGLVMLLYVGGFNWDHSSGFLSLLLSDDAKANPVLGYSSHMKILTILFTLSLIIVAFFAARKVFNLQEGVIRKRGYPFYTMMALAFVMLIDILSIAPPTEVHQQVNLPLYWYTILNIMFVVRLVEEFFFWSNYQLRSDRNKIEARQHTQALLIRRVIASSDKEDLVMIREAMESSLDKVKERMVVPEYRMTGMTVRRAVGNILRVEDVGHISGYCTPLSENKNIKSLDKAKLNDLILRTTYDVPELQNTPLEDLKDFGKRLLKQAMTANDIAISTEMPEGIKGLQRLVAVVPIFDGTNFVGSITVFKDSFDKLYPAERGVLFELAENLATIFALISGKEVQRERNRLQGEMNIAKDLQTAILPKNIVMDGYEVGSFMETASEVGGDVFDFLPTPFGNYFGIGDVSGHGLPAGMMAVISIAALHGALDASKVLGKPLPLDQVFDSVNRVLCTLNRDRIGSDKFMTQNYFFEKNGKIQGVGSHLVTVIFRREKGEFEEIPGLSGRAGYMGLSEFAVSAQSLVEFSLKPGDLFILYSDGVSEAKNANGTMFGLDGIKNSMAEHADKAPADIIAGLLDNLRRHAAGGDLKKHGGFFTDDISLVVLKKS
ncbi:MAG: SpoIIE family protein phosphatase [Spirochaetales bacterium]